MSSTIALMWDRRSASGTIRSCGLMRGLGLRTLRRRGRRSRASRLESSDVFLALFPVPLVLLQAFLQRRNVARCHRCRCSKEINSSSTQHCTPTHHQALQLSLRKPKQTQAHREVEAGSWCRAPWKPRGKAIAPESSPLGANPPATPMSPPPQSRNPNFSILDIPRCLSRNSPQHLKCNKIVLSSHSIDGIENTFQRLCRDC